MSSFSLEYCSNRAILLLHTILSFLLSLLPSSLPTASRPPRLSAKAIKDSLHVLTYAEICHVSHHDGEEERDRDHEHDDHDEEGNDTCDGSTPATCAVCLSWMKRKDEVRELRNCRHVFHRGCLDRWVDHDENGTCPLCRAPLIDRNRKAVPAPPPGPSWAVDRLLYLFGDDLLVSAAALPSSSSSSL